MLDILPLIGRSSPLFEEDINNLSEDLLNIVSSSRFLVLGAAGSIGQSVTKEIFKRNPVKLHIVDISENNLVELVRDIRSSYGYIDGDFKTFAIDIGSTEYDAFIENDGLYDFVINLSALKHVRSEEDSYTLMRMIEVNIFNTIKTIKQSAAMNVKKYFCVSTDKAANPANLMGASKRIMEMFLFKYSKEIKISTARFANVAFSDGSLLHSFNQRIKKNQPLVAPNDIKRYFVTKQESGELCLLSTIFGHERDIFFPNLNKELHLETFSNIAKRFLNANGYDPHICDSEEEARLIINELIENNKWPLYISKTDTTGEKEIEEFYTNDEFVDLKTFKNIGIVKNEPNFDNKSLNLFEKRISDIKQKGKWKKQEIVDIFFDMIPGFNYEEKGRFLDEKM